MSDEEAQLGRTLFAEMLPAAPLDLYDLLDEEMRGWYIKEAKRKHG